jgi:hypothetical protein
MHKVDKQQKPAYSPNEMAIYEESCWCARVLIVDNDSDEKFVRCTLEVLEDISPIPAEYALPVGTQFQYTRCRDFVCAGIARLYFEPLDA